MGYLIRLSRRVTTWLGSNNASIKKFEPLAPNFFALNRSIPTFDIFQGQDLGNAQSRSACQMQKARDLFSVYVGNEVDALQVFSDGSVMDKSSGKGGCGCFVQHTGLNLNCSSSRSSGRLTENVACEVEGIKLGLEQAMQAFEDWPISSSKCLIFCDCESAIQIVSAQSDFAKHSKILIEINAVYDNLRARNVDVVLCWVPGHCGIQGNELADRAAKDGCRLDAAAASPIEVPLQVVKRFAKLESLSNWQRKWSHSSSAGNTRDTISAVNSHRFQDTKRCTSMTLARSLLNLDGVAETMHRFGFSDSPNCACGTAR